MITRAFNNWWNAYFKKFIRSFDQIKEKADALLAKDQPIREKKQAKRKADPSGASKKNTKKLKGDKASTSTKASKAKTYVVPPVPTAPTLQLTNPETSAIRLDASSGTKISEGEQLLPKGDVSKKKKAKQTPSRIESDSSDSGSTPSKIISPVPRPQNSPIIESNKSDKVPTRRTKEAVPPESSSDTSIQVDPKPNSEKNKNTSNPSSPQDSDDLLLDLTNLVAELHKAASDTVFDTTVQSDSINKSIQQVIQREADSADKTKQGPTNERPNTPPNKYGMSKEVVDALCWLINLLTAQIEDNVDHEEIHRRVKLAVSHFHSVGAPEEAAPIEAVPLLKKETEEQLAAIKREEKDERALYEKFLKNQGTTKQALEDILTEYNS
ncbi:hypothetical protein PIB30_019597 [Stylosanthes scabra]|uniref:Uncharacterized protein n=1 Tax=Stylosanthes scabra TaxID=79078 RepID=A0ABU6Z4W8_9FABA|nr:hypothetical protein [Stylosanthes scabra]